MKLFADSGAYSAWTNNINIDLQEYIDFIQLHKNQLETYACLDDITDPDKTWANQKEMERQGLNPLPVYHVTEDEKFLKKAMCYDYFAVGGMSLKGSTTRTNRFDDIFSKVCTKENNYFPTHKIHGFGLASPNLLIKYPWYSADSSSWVQYGRYGIILIPRIKNDIFYYNQPPIVLTISSRSKSISKENHFRNMANMDKKWIADYCLSKGFKIGRTLFKDVSSDYKLKENENWMDRKTKNRIEKVVEKGLCCDGEMRDRINLQYFLDLEKFQPKWPWKWLIKHDQIFTEDLLK